jgi:K+-transporting ATPase KdpF subunit
MSAVQWIAACVTLALFVYLFVALFKPESFD